MTNTDSTTSLHAAEITRKVFGITGTASSLRSERDENFVIRGDAGVFLLKLTNPAEDRAVTTFHTNAMLHLATRDPGLPIPRLLQAKDGTFQIEVSVEGGRVRMARLMSFLPGITAAEAPRCRGLRQAIGRMLARFDFGLVDFSDPAEHDVSWDLKHALRLQSLIGEIEVKDVRRRVECALNQFQTCAIPALAGLREQVIHNDFNLFNVLVDKADLTRITGVVDFGDMVRAPLINDVAIASSYHFENGHDPLGPPLEIVGAYHAVFPLTEEEIDLLFDLISTRLAMTVLITESRAKRFPENRAYILKNHHAATLGLKQLEKFTRSEAQDQFRRACGLHT